MAMQQLQVGQIRGAVEDSRAHMIDLDVSSVNKESEQNRGRLRGDEILLPLR